MGFKDGGVENICFLPWVFHFAPYIFCREGQISKVDSLFRRQLSVPLLGKFNFYPRVSKLHNFFI